MSKYLCIAAVHHIRVDAPLDRGERLGADIRLTNDTKVIEQLLGRRTLPIFGVLETNAIKQSPLVAYSLVDSPHEPSPAAANHAVLGFLGELKKFQTALWLVRDNAVSLENAFVEWPHGDPSALCHTNQWDGLCTNASGKRDMTVFSRDEFRDARLLHDKIWLKEEEPIVHGPSEPTEPESGRTGRATYFLQGARRSAALSVKVAHYCTAFESLLSTDSTELSHKLAERLAWLLASTPEERLSIFRTLKASYGIRSRAVHGASLSRKKIEDDLVRAAHDCDELLRKLILRIASSDDLRALYLRGETPAEQLEEKLLALALGAWRPDGGAA